MEFSLSMKFFLKKKFEWLICKWVSEMVRKWDYKMVKKLSVGEGAKGQAW